MKISENMLMYLVWISVLFHHVQQELNTMEVTPNWKHHSNKLRKPKRNPVAIRQSRARLQALKRKLNLLKQGRS